MTSYHNLNVRYFSHKYVEYIDSFCHSRSKGKLYLCNTALYLFNNFVPSDPSFGLLFILFFISPHYSEIAV